MHTVKVVGVQEFNAIQNERKIKKVIHPFIQLTLSKDMDNLDILKQTIVGSTCHSVLLNIRRFSCDIFIFKILSKLVV